MSDSERIEEEDLLAYADDRLAPERRVAVEAWLAAHPARSAEVRAWVQQNEAIAALYGPVAAERIPDRLNPRLVALRQGRESWRRPLFAVAATIILAVGLGSGYILRDLLDPPETPSALLIDSAVTAHALYVRENRHAVEVAADDRQHLVTWLSSRIQTPIDAPDLAAEGFNLVGGRLLPEGLYTEVGPAAQFMYENAAAERLTVYVTGALPDRETAYRFTKVAGLDAFYWANGRITCTVVGDLPQETMQVVATKVYQQLTRRPDPGYPRGS